MPVIEQYLMLIDPMASIEFKKWQTQQEIRLRGTYLRLAADTEWSLRLICAQIYGNDIQQFDKFRKAPFYRWRLSDLLDVVSKGLEKHYPDIFSKYKSDLKIADRLRDYRNRFAHGKIEWDDENENPDIVRITMVTKRGLEVGTYNFNILFQELVESTDSLKNLLSIIRSFIHN
jgi:hypothetical protein